MDLEDGTSKKVIKPGQVTQFRSAPCNTISRLGSKFLNSLTTSKTVIGGLRVHCPYCESFETYMYIHHAPKTDFNKKQTAYWVCESWKHTPILHRCILQYFTIMRMLSR